MLGGAELFVFCVGDIQWQLQLHAGVDGFMPSSSFNALQPCLAPTKLSFAKQSKSSLKQLLKKLKTETDVLKHGVAKEDFDGAMCSNAIQGIMADGGKLQLDGKLCGNLWIPIPFFLFIIIACFFALSVLLACNCKSNTVFSKSIVCGATDKLVLTVSINTLKLLTYLNPELFNLLVTKVFLRTRD